MPLTPAQIATLKTELTNDPQALGYAPHRTAGATAKLAELLNATNPATTVFSSSVSGSDIISCLVAAEYTALSQANRDLFQAIVTAAPLDATKSSTRTLIGAIFGAGATRTALLAIASRPGSRAEILFAPNVSVTTDDVAAALLP